MLVDTTTRTVPQANSTDDKARELEEGLEPEKGAKPRPLVAARHDAEEDGVARERHVPVEHGGEWGRLEQPGRVEDLQVDEERRRLRAVSYECLPSGRTM